MNLGLITILTILLQSPAAMIDEAFVNADLIKAEQLILAHIPESPQRTLYLARIAIEKKQIGQGEKLYYDVLNDKKSTLKERTTAYIALFQILETKPFNANNRKAVRTLLEKAIEDSPKGSRIQRMFILRQAKFYEKINYETPNGILYHLFMPGYDMLSGKPQNKALQIYLEVLKSKESLPRHTVWTATYGAAKMWRHAGQFEKAEALLQELWNTKLSTIERGNCALALTDHYIAAEPVWKQKKHPMWKQINEFLTSPDIPPEYKGRIFKKLADAAAKYGTFNESNSYYNRAVNISGLTYNQRLRLMQQQIAAAKKAKMFYIVYNTEKRIYMNHLTSRGLKLHYLNSMTKYLAEKNNKTEFNSLIQHGIKSSFKMTSAEVRKYRQLFNQYRKKQTEKK